MKTFEQFINETMIGDLFKNQVELFISNEKVDKQLFTDCQNLGSEILENNGVVIKCKNYVKSCFIGMGYKNLTDENIELNFYEPEKVIVAIIPDGVLKSFGKTGQSVSMRHTNIIVFEKTQWENDIEKWIEHEVGHVVSWRDYKDTPKIKNQFITGTKFGANDNVFDPKNCFGHNMYPNVWFEYIPFTRQIKYLLKSNTSENLIRLMMKDYELGHTSEDLVKYEQIFINYLNVVLNKNSGVKNKYQK